MVAVQGAVTSAVEGTAPTSKVGPHGGTVDVWRAHLALPPDELSRLWRCLDGEEQQRAARFRFQRDRDRFVASRAVLRHLLGGYLDSSPNRIRFGYAPGGKPLLLDHPDLQFNLSHAADVLLVGIALERELGVDVEQVFSAAVMDEVSESVLSVPERAAFGAVDPGERCEWFLRLWTRKEAYIKADGRGMSLPLDRIDVSTRPGRVRLRSDSSLDWLLSDRWSIRELPVASGYAAALVSEGLDWQVAYFDWLPDA